MANWINGPLSQVTKPKMKNNAPTMAMAPTLLRDAWAVDMRDSLPRNGTAVLAIET